MENNQEKIQEEKELLNKEKIEAVKDKAALSERQRMQALNEAFADDPQFAIEAFTAGKTLEQAKGDYCDVLKAKMKEQAAAVQETITASGAEAIGTEDTDSGGAGDFMAAARELAKEEKIPVTDAMKKVRRDNPRLHGAYLNRNSAKTPAQVYGRTG